MQFPAHCTDAVSKCHDDSQQIRERVSHRANADGVHIIVCGIFSECIKSIIGYLESI